MYYRSKMEQKKRQEEEQFITKLDDIPVIHSAWTQAWDLYQKTKERNMLLRATFGVAESGVKVVAGSTLPLAKPLVSRYQPQINQVNMYLCQQLDRLEEQYPVVTKPTEELLQDGKQAVEAKIKPTVDRVNAIRKYSSDTYNNVVTKGREDVAWVAGLPGNTICAIKDFGVDQVHKGMETRYGQYASNVMNDAMTLSEEYMDKYLPVSEGEEEEENKDEKAEVDEVPEDVVTRANKIQSRFRRRLYKRALRDLKGLKMRSEETMAHLNFTVNLIDFAKNNMDSTKTQVQERMQTAQTKLSNVWNEITSEEEPKLPPTLEGQSIAVARVLTRQLRNGVHTFTSYLPVTLQPQAVQDSMKAAQTFAEELYVSFRDASKFQDLPSWIMTQSKAKLTQIEEALTFVTDKLFSSKYNWMVPSIKRGDTTDGDGSEMEMEEIEQTNSKSHTQK